MRPETGTAGACGRPAVLRALAVLAMATLGAAGCTTETVAERTAACQTDWYAYGLTDGRLGVPIGDRAERFEDCGELGLPPDLAAYEAGRARGLLAYCTAESGYEAGRDRRPYHDVCAGQADIAFRQGYERGREERHVGRGYGGGATIGLGLGVGSRRSYGGIGIGLPLYWRDRHGFYPRHGCLTPICGGFGPYYYDD